MGITTSCSANLKIALGSESKTEVSITYVLRAEIELGTRWAPVCPFGFREPVGPAIHPTLGLTSCNYLPTRRANKTTKRIASAQLAPAALFRLRNGDFARHRPAPLARSQCVESLAKMLHKNKIQNERSATVKIQKVFAHQMCE